MTPKSEYEYMTWRQIMADMATDIGVQPPTDDRVNFILWEKTPFPFASLEKTLDHIHAYLSGVRLCARCGDPVEDGTWACELCTTVLMGSE